MEYVRVGTLKRQHIAVSDLGRARTIQRRVTKILCEPDDESGYVCRGLIQWDGLHCVVEFSGRLHLNFVHIWSLCYRVTPYEHWVLWENLGFGNSHRPDKANWTGKYRRCVECGSTERQQIASGLCSLCYGRVRYRDPERRELQKKYAREHMRKRSAIRRMERAGE